MYGHMGMGFGLGFLNFIGTILFFVAVFWALKFLFRGGFRGGHGGGHGGRGRYAKLRGDWAKGRYGGPRPWERGPDEADKVMRERLAKGEITEDEYNRLKSQLGSNGDGSDNGPASTSAGRPDGGPLSWLRGDDALEVARLRLAKGEITADEFQTLRRVLTS